MTTGSVLARFSAPRADQPTRIAVLSDLHLSLDKEGTWRVSHRTEERMAAAVASLNARDLDAVFFAGDLVQSGARAEYGVFDPLRERIAAPFYAIPGNHDLIHREGADQFTLPEFEDRYTPGGLPYRERVGGVDLVALSSNASTRDALTDSYAGRVSEASLSWLDDALADATAPLVAVHHTLDAARERYADGQSHLPVAGGSPGFENAADLVDVLEAHGTPLVLTGHLHFPAVARFGAGREFTLPSLGPFPCGYTLLEIDGAGTTATFRPVAGFEGRLEALRHGLEQDRVLLAAAQLAGLPLVDDGRPPEE